MLGNWFVDNLTIASVTRDVYGAVTPATQVSVKGLIRDYLEIVLNDDKEQVDTTAIAWLPPTTVISVGDIIRGNGENFRAVKVVRAKRGGSTDVLFIKCWLQPEKAVGGIS